MKNPSQAAEELRRIASKIENSKNPSRKLVGLDLRNFVQSIDGKDFHGMRLVKAKIIEYEPGTLKDTGWATVVGEFEFKSPSGKKVEVKGRSAPDNFDIKVWVDGKELEWPKNDDGTTMEDWPLHYIDPDGYPSDDDYNSDAWDSIHDVMEEVAEAEAKSKSKNKPKFS